MSCKEAMIEAEIIAVHPEQTISEIMSLYEENAIRAVPVLDDGQHLVGIFSLNTLLTQLLPSSVRMEDGLQRLNFVTGSAPGVAKRLAKIMPLKVKEAMDTDCVVLHPDMPIWEAVRLMSKYGSPLPVVSEENRKLVGLVSGQSMLAYLRTVLEDIDEAE